MNDGYMVTITLPTGDRAGTPLPEEQVARALRATQDFLTGELGGCTTINAQGIWQDEDVGVYALDGLVREAVVLVSSYGRKPYVSFSARVHTHCDLLARELNQGSVMYTFVPCVAEFVKP